MNVATATQPGGVRASEHSARSETASAEPKLGANRAAEIDRRGASHSVPFNVQDPIVDRVESISSSIIAGLPSGYAYHSLEHTRQVVENARFLARAASLPENDTMLTLTAAWLHDVGFEVTYFGHEEESCKIARSVLTELLNDKDIRTVESAIRATKIPQQATNPIAEVLCDADLLYLGGNEFSLWSGRLREEHLHCLNRTYNDIEWLDINLDFMRDRTFYTAYARENYGAGLERNFRALEQMKRELTARA